MLCLLFGVMIAALTYNWLGEWSVLAGIVAAASVFSIMKFWPAKKRKDAQPN